MFPINRENSGEETMINNEHNKCNNCSGWMLRNAFGFWCNQCQRYYKAAIDKHGVSFKHFWKITAKTEKLEEVK